MRLIGVGPDNRMPSFKGIANIRKTATGWIIAAAPRKRGRRLSARQRAAIELFRQQVLSIKYRTVKELNAATALAHGTSFLPRDVLMICGYGRLFSILNHRGVMFTAMASQRDLNVVLDVLSQTPGTMAYRGLVDWVGIPPGADGQILTFHTVGSLPTWENPPTGAAGDPFLSAPAFDPSTNSAAHGGNIYLGRLFVPTQDVTISQLNIWLRAFTGTNAYAALYESAAGALTGATLLDQGTAAAPGTGAVSALAFSAPQDLIAGHFYWPGIIYNGGGTVTPALGNSEVMRFFSHTTGTAPGTAPASTSSVSNFFPVWAS